MALIGSSTSDIGDTNVTSRKRRKSSVGVKRQNEFNRDFASFSSGGSGCSGDYNPTATTTTIMSTNSDNYTTVISSSLYSGGATNRGSGSGNSLVASQFATPIKFQDRGQNVSMKIQFQITTSPDMDMLPPTPTVASTSCVHQQSPLLMKYRSNSTMVPSSQQTTATTTTTLDHYNGSDNEPTIAARRHQLQILHQQKIDSDEQRQNQVLNAGSSFKREHRRRPSTTIGVNLDSKGSVTNHHNIAAISGQCQSEDSAKDKIAAMQTASLAGQSGLATRSATFGSFSGSDTNSRPSEESLMESIYFKRDGQRFNHEFTLKLSVDRTYRCLLKIKPSIPLQSISIQGHHIRFHDCTQTSQQSRLNKFATATIHGHHHQQQQTSNGAAAAETTNPKHQSANISSVNHHQQQQSISPIHHLTKHFLHTHSHTHNSGQLIYVFDWSASRFEVNKNKARTEVQMVLKFKNGESLMLPLQVKFYYSDCRQHLNWGSLLHFIDYDCLINKLGNINVNRVQFY